jgi:hypothetical protein
MPAALAAAMAPLGGVDDSRARWRFLVFMYLCAHLSPEVTTHRSLISLLSSLSRTHSLKKKKKKKKAARVLKSTPRSTASALFCCRTRV